MKFNWILTGFMLGYAFFNGIGSYFYKKALARIPNSNISFIKWNSENLRAFKSLILDPIWILGLICLGLDFILYQFALRTFEISVVKPLVNLNLIFVLFFGLVILREPLNRFEWTSLFFIVFGAILISLNATESTPIFSQTLFWGFTFINCALIGISIILSRSILKFRFEILGSIACGFFYGLGSIYNKMLFTTAIPAGYQILSLVFFILCYVFAFLLGQTAYLKGRMSLVSPLVNIISILIPFIGGVLIFKDSLVFGDQTGLFRWTKIYGLLLILVGVLLNFHPKAVANQKNVSKNKEISHD